MFKSIVIEDFMSIEKLDLDLEDLGLVLIEGPNGSGKSSIFEALLWCLFERTVRGFSKDEVIRQGAKHCRVMVGIENPIGETTFVTRTRKHPQLGNSFRIDDTTISQGKQGERTSIKSLIGLDYSAFLYTVIMGQNSGMVLSNASDKEQKSLYESVLITEDFGEIQEKVLVDLEKTEESRKDLVSKMRSASEQKESIEKRITEIKPLYDGWSLRQKQRIQQVDEEIKGLNQRLGFLGGTKTHGAEGFERLKAEIEKYENQVKELSETKDKLSNESNTLQKQMAVESQKWETNKEQLEKKLESLISKKEEVNKDESSRCPKCFSVITKETREAHLAHIESLIKETQKELVEARKDFVFSEETLLKETEDSLISLVEDLNSVSAELKDRQSQIEIWNKHFTALDEELQKVKTLLAVKTMELDNLKKEHNPHDYKNLEDQLKDLDASLEFLPGNIEKTEIALSCLQFLYEMFSDKGLKSYLFDYIVGPLNSTAAYYSQILTQSRFNIEFSTIKELKSGELRENFNIKVVNQEGAKDYRGLSGGEKKRVDVLILKTVREVLGSRSKFPINLSVFDEFTSDLDVMGRELVFNLIEHEVSEKGTTFLITHDEELKSKFQFRNRKIISVSKDGRGVSQFEQNF